MAPILRHCAALGAFFLFCETAFAIPTYPIHGHAAQVKQRISDITTHYDYIIVGGGTSGLTVADRLTEAFPNRTVLVVEYGDLPDGKSILVPGTSSFDPRYMFNLQSVEQSALNNRSVSVTVGKVVGGSSAVNAQMFDRGSAADYDAWAAVSAPFTDAYNKAGWNWKGLLPYFRKSVTFTPPTAEEVKRYGYTYNIGTAYGLRGPIQASYPPFQWPTTELLWQAWGELGIPTQREAAGGNAYGRIYLPSSQDAKTQTRSYARTGHYDPVRNRTNYHLLPNHQVLKLNLKINNDGSVISATGVEIRPVGGNRTRFTVISDHEVILAAGTIHTPQVLQRSGIGPTQVLQDAGVKVVLDLPGVGQNFQDHPSSSFFFDLATDLSPNAAEMFMNDTILQGYTRQYQENKTGPFTLSGGNLGVFLPLSSLTNSTPQVLSALSSQNASSYLPAGTHPTILSGYASQLRTLQTLLSSSKAAVFEFPIASGAAIASFLKPLSRGTVNLNPSDPDGEPLIDYRAFTNPLDITLATLGLRMQRRLFSTPSAQRLTPTELIPGTQVQTDEDWDAWIRANTRPSFWHPVGTAALMAKEAGGVVAPDCRIHGVQNVRVVDASLFPLVPGTHTSSSVYAVAEKAAEIITRAGR